MVSAIRLLPRQKVDRHTLRYKQLVGHVLRVRFGRALKLSLLVAGVESAVMKTAGISGFWRGFVALSMIMVVILAHLKAEMTVTTHPQPSWVLQKLRDTFSWRFVRNVACYLAAAGLWYCVVVIPCVPDMQYVIQVENADTNASEHVPPGLPRHFASGVSPQAVKTHNNPRPVYLALYGLGLAVLHAVIERGNLAFREDELALRAMERLRYRTPNAMMRVLKAVGAHTILLFVESLIAPTVPRVSVALALGRAPQIWIPATIAVEVTIQIFDTYMTLGPVHHIPGQPNATLSEASADSNGSLVTGLTAAPSSITQLTAWHELLLIAAHRPERRGRIFADADADRVVWTQLFSAWSRVVTEATTVLEEPTRVRKAREAAKRMAQKHLAETKRLDVATQSSSSHVHPADPKLWARRTHRHFPWLERLQGDAETAVFAWINQHWQQAHEKLSTCFRTRLEKFLMSQLGWPFRQTQERRFEALLPEPQRTNVQWAVQALGELIVASHDEDPIGYVQVTIGSYLDKVEALVRALNEYKAVSALDQVRYVAETEFSRVVNQFWPYFDNLHLEKRTREHATNIMA